MIGIVIHMIRMLGIFLPGPNTCNKALIYPEFMARLHTLWYSAAWYTNSHMNAKCLSVCNSIERQTRSCSLMIQVLQVKKTLLIWVSPIMGNEFKTMYCLLITQFHNPSYHVNIWTVARNFTHLTNLQVSLPCPTLLSWYNNWRSP